MLWFAWKIVLLQYRKQHAPSPDGRKPCCDLLEKSYFCSIANNHHNLRQIERMVVICLKNRTFAVSQTTFRKGVEKDWSCDLLEKSYFCSIANNLFPRRKQNHSVVICLKNRTFAVSQTTHGACHPQTYQLWFAWKIVLLQYRKQQQTKQINITSSCDLLEKSYFCSIANNGVQNYISGENVVICLKNRTFAVSQTTVIAQYQIKPRLWFAWKIVLLQYRKQRFSSDVDLIMCCDLLEKSYFCSIANNSCE